MSDFTEKQLSDLALAAAKEAVRQYEERMFGLLGVNVANFDSVQSLREDLSFVRHMRTGVSAVGRRFSLTIVGLIASAILLAFWESLKAWLHTLHILP